MSKPIKVLHVVTSLSRHGGIEETLRILCQHLDSEVFQIGICTIKDRPQDVLEIFKNMNVQIFYGSRAGQIFDLFTTVWVRSVIKHFQADIVHTHNNKGNFHGRIAGKFPLFLGNLQPASHDSYQADQRIRTIRFRISKDSSEKDFKKTCLT